MNRGEHTKRAPALLLDRTLGKIHTQKRCPPWGTVQHRPPRPPQEALQRRCRTDPLQCPMPAGARHEPVSARLRAVPAGTPNPINPR